MDIVTLKVENRVILDFGGIKEVFRCVGKLLISARSLLCEQNNTELRKVQLQGQNMSVLRVRYLIKNAGKQAERTH